jgi:hypothetical protein
VYVGLDLVDLDLRTRVHMVSEFDDDVRRGAVYLSPLLSDEGRRQWPDLLRIALHTHDGDWLADTLEYNDLVESLALRGSLPRLAHVSPGAGRALAESQFTCYYMRGVCRRAIDEGVPRLRLYRARDSAAPCPRSSALLERGASPEVLLVQLRRECREAPTFGIPGGPSLGLSVCLPR